MSQYVPSFFIPIDSDECPRDLDDWHSAEPLLAEKWEARRRNGLRTVSSRNAWLQFVTIIICEHLHITGLDFFQREIACLDASQIEAGLKAVETLMFSCRHGIPRMPAAMEKEDILFLRTQSTSGKYKKLSARAIDGAYVESQAFNELDEYSIPGVSDLWIFFSFLKTLRAVMQDCHDHGKQLLYVYPAL